MYSNCPLTFDGHPVVVAENGIDAVEKLIRFINKKRRDNVAGYFSIAVTHELFYSMLKEVRHV